MAYIFGQNKKIKLLAPLTGEVVNLSEVPDAVFSNKITGDGLAIEPSVGKLVAPINAKVKKVFSTKHAIILEIANKINILIHLGIDTVALKDNDIFSCLVSEGQNVSAGQQLIKFDLENIKNNATSILTPVLIIDMEKIIDIKFTDLKEVRAGKDEIMKVFRY